MAPVCPKTVRRRMDRAGRRRRTRPPGTTGFQKSPRSIAVPQRTHHTSTTQTIMNKTRRQPVILEWTDTQLALLGSMSDSRVAELLGISCRTVGAQRVKRGISASGQTTHVAGASSGGWCNEHQPTHLEEKRPEAAWPDSRSGTCSVARHHAAGSRYETAGIRHSVVCRTSSENSLDARATRTTGRSCGLTTGPRNRYHNISRRRTPPPPRHRQTQHQISPKNRRMKVSSRR